MKSPVRIAYLASFAPKKLGTGEDRLMLLARTAAEQNHQLTLFCHGPVHSKIAATYEESGHSIVELSTLTARPLRAILMLARKFDAVVLNAIAPRSRLATICYLAWPTKVFYVDHSSGPAVEIDYEGQPLWRRMLDRLTFLRIYRSAGVSKHVRDRLLKRFQMDDYRVRALYGGVDVDRFRPPNGRRQSERFQISVVAALIEEKGVDTLIKAVAEEGNPHWRLQIIGEGPDESRLRGLVRDHGLEESVEFLGLRDDVDELLRQTDVFVHPATWNEALGYTVLEGMASGCPVIASETGAIPEVIRDNQNGLLVPPGSVSQLRDRLKQLSTDVESRERLGKAARQTIVDKFSLERNVGETLDWVTS